MISAAPGQGTAGNLVDVVVEVMAAARWPAISTRNFPPRIHTHLLPPWILLVRHVQLSIIERRSPVKRLRDDILTP